jgi:large subunit ribosomal protein L3
MSYGLLGKKIGMSQTFDENGVIIPVTLIEAGPCHVLQKKTVEADGYNALQLGFDPHAKNGGNRPMAGHLKPAGINAPRIIREFRTNEGGDLEVGAKIEVDIFEAGEKVDVTGVSKGRGFAGPIKRHNSSRGPESHGSRYHRRTGSIGMSAYPSHVFKGKKMPGRMGGERATVQNLVILQADKERNLLIIKGSVPGHNNGYVVINKATRVRKKKAGR